MYNSASQTLDASSRVRIRRLLKQHASAGETCALTKPLATSQTVEGSEPCIVALVPSHNEADAIEGTLEALADQSQPVDEVIVIADNCTDDTGRLAIEAGASVLETVANHEGKAGALNQALELVLPLLSPDDCVMVLDADTKLTENFVETAVERLFDEHREPIGGVGGIFLERDGDWNLIRQLQANEYIRYQRRIARRRGRALVLTGTGAVFKSQVLAHVKYGRQSGQLPDDALTGSVYDTAALTEDNELTLSLKSLGYQVTSPKECTLHTALKPNARSLFKQRRRWQRGALENLLAHETSMCTIPYVIRQIFKYLGVIFLPFYLLSLTVALVSKSEINFFEPLWLAVALLYLVEQTFSVRRGGWRAILTSVAVVPEIFMNVFLNIVYTVAYFDTLFARDESWGRKRNPRLTKRNSLLETDAQLSQKAPDLHGTHLNRQHPISRCTQALLLLATLGTIGVLMLIPLANLQLAWQIIAVYVLAGSLATVSRLIPLKTA